MKKHFLNLMLISFAFASISTTTPPKGFNYSSREGKFSVVFPAQYTVDAKENTIKISATSNEQTYYASYTIHNVELTNRKELAEISLNSFSDILKSPIIEQSDWKTNKNTGLQATLNMQEKNIKIKYYVVLVGQIQYQMIVMAENALFDQKAADAFVKSFKLDK